MVNVLRLDSNIKSKSLNNTYLNIIKIFNKLFKKKFESMLLQKLLIFKVLF